MDSSPKRLTFGKDIQRLLALGMGFSKGRLMCVQRRVTKTLLQLEDLFVRWERQSALRIGRRRQRFQPHQLDAICQANELQKTNSPPVEVNFVPGQTMAG